jgi:hypothetical protein
LKIKRKLYVSSCDVRIVCPQLNSGDIQLAWRVRREKSFN